MPTTDTRLWAVDKVVLAYFTFAGLLVAIGWRQVPDSGLRLSGYLAAMALLLWQVKHPNRTSWIFRNWYPLPYVGCCYKEMAVLITSLRHSDADQWLADVDFRFWGVHPTVWLERLQTPALTEYLQIVYTLFIPAVLLVAFVLWRKGLYAEFQYYAFLIALGFLASYVGYLLVPARGPRFLLSHLQHVPLRGTWLFGGMQSTLDRLESAHYDCFPSGHTELSILAWWSTGMISKRLFWVYFAYTLSIIFATVYLRYHYTVDLLAGSALALVLILAAPLLYRRLSERA